MFFIHIEEMYTFIPIKFNASVQYQMDEAPYSPKLQNNSSEKYHSLIHVSFLSLQSNLWTLDPQTNDICVHWGVRKFIAKIPSQRFGQGLCLVLS